jgi:hypothetical protein
VSQNRARARLGSDGEAAAMGTAVEQRLGDRKEIPSWARVSRSCDVLLRWVKTVSGLWAAQSDEHGGVGDRFTEEGTPALI